MNNIKWAANTLPKTDDKYTPLFNEQAANEALNFHQGFPEYSVTPLRKLSNLASEMGLGGVYVKDESYRFGLNAFKVLGGSFAIGKFVMKQLESTDAPDYAFLTSDKFSKEFAPCTFFTATDGNHGRGVAWSAKRLNQKAVVLMPKGTVASRFDNIKKLGAEVSIEPMNYDDCVRKAAELSAQTPSSVVIQDTAWEGYEEIPAWIMQGYTTLISEAAKQLDEMDVVPTHVILQAGVGSMAAAVAAYLVNRYGENCPKIIVAECSAADCFYRSAAAGDGLAVNVEGDLDSIMAGLCCGEVNPIGWDILKNHACCFLSCEDNVAAAGMRRLSAPMGGDERVISGESGAIGTGVLAELCRNDNYAELKKLIGLDENSHVLLISTEGDTDPERYRKVVWDGAFSNE